MTERTLVIPTSAFLDFVIDSEMTQEQRNKLEAWYKNHVVTGKALFVHGPHHTTELLSQDQIDAVDSMIGDLK